MEEEEEEQGGTTGQGIGLLKSLATTRPLHLPLRWQARNEDACFEMKG